MFFAGCVRILLFWPLAAGLASLCLGCGLVATDKPLYDGHEAVLDPQLPGIWVARGDSPQQDTMLIIARGDGRHYRLSELPTQPGAASGDVEMDLVRLGRYEYLFPSVPDWSGTVLFPAYRVRVAGREMRMSLLNQPQFVEELKNHPGMLNYTEKTVDILHPAATQPSAGASQASATQPTTGPDITNVVLTDAPQKIRQLLIQHEDDPNWFAQVLVLHRITPGPRR